MSYSCDEYYVHGSAFFMSSIIISCLIIILYLRFRMSLLFSDCTAKLACVTIDFHPTRLDLPRCSSDWLKVRALLNQV